MKYQITAPSYLLPPLSARLALNAPRLEYSLCTPQIGSLDPTVPHLVFQSDFFHPTSTETASVDVFVMPSPLASVQGFMLAAGGEHENLAKVAPILDTLAPIPSGWLHAGEYGSAGFFHQLWCILIGTHANGPLPLWENMRIPSGAFQINHPDLVNQLSSLMAQQQLITQSLASCSQRFLTEHPALEFSPYHPQQKQLLGSEALNRTSPAHEIAILLSSFQTT